MITTLADLADDDANSTLAAAIGLTRLGASNHDPSSSPNEITFVKTKHEILPTAASAFCDVIDRKYQKSTIELSTLVKINKADDISNTDIRMLNFPKLIYFLLSEEDLYGSIICWLPDGKRFVIHDRHRFTAEILHIHFENCKWTSFTRRLKRWKFDRVSSGPDIGAYYNKNFIRDRPDFLSLLMYSMEDMDDGEEDGTKKDMVQVSKDAVSSKPKPFSVREWQRSEKMKKEASKFAKLLHYQPKMLYQQKAGPRSANDGQDDVLLAPTVGDDIISSPSQDDLKVNVDSTLPASSRQSGTSDVNTYPVLNTNNEKVRSVPRSAKDGHAVLMASTTEANHEIRSRDMQKRQKNKRIPFMPTPNVIDDSTLPTTGLNNYLSQNHLLVMRQQCQLGSKQVRETAEYVPPMAKRSKISSSFEQDYQAAYTALKEITGMNSTALPHPSFAKKVSSIDEIVDAVADRFVAMLDTLDYQTASLALKKITGMESAPSPPHSFTKKVSGSELGHAVAVHHSVVDSNLINSSSHHFSLRGITEIASPGSMDELSAVCQQDGISRHNLPVLNNPNPSQIKEPIAKQQQLLDTDNRSYIKYQMPSGTLFSLPSSGYAFSVPPPGSLNTSYVSQHLKMTRNSNNCNDLDSSLSSSSLIASSGDIFTHRVMTNKDMHHMNNMIASSEHEADISLLQMQEQAAIMSEIQQRIISQQEQNRQIRIRQRQLLLQMYHHQYQLALQSPTPPSQKTMKILMMLRDLKDKMLLETNNRVMITNDYQFEQQFLDLLQLLEFSIGGNSSAGMVVQKK